MYKSALSFHNCLSTLFPKPPGAHPAAWHVDDDNDEDDVDDDDDVDDVDDDNDHLVHTVLLNDMFCNML